jgi:glycine/D-amino acid oxidase-like deaminating enzyme
MNIKETNYWLETVAEPARGADGPLPETADVAIVGAGFCGISAARALAMREIRVVVLEAETLGWGASSRNGGMVLTGMKLPVPTLIDRYGREAVQRMYAASLESIDLVEQIVRDEGIACEFSRCGHLEVACKQAHSDLYAESAARIKKEFNHELRIVPKAELRSEIGSDIYFGGMVDETSAGVNPAQYVNGLAKAAQRHGACLFDHTRVLNVKLQENAGNRQFSVETSRGNIAAKEVLLASGAYTTGATPGLRKKVIPIGSYIIATEVLRPELALELSPRNRMIYDSKHFLYYYRPRRVFSGIREYRATERRNSATWDGQCLSAASRCQGRIRVGRHVGLHVRRNAACRKTGWNVFRVGFCGPWSGCGNLDRYEAGCDDLR